MTKIKDIVFTEYLSFTEKINNQHMQILQDIFVIFFRYFPQKKD